MRKRTRIVLIVYFFLNLVNQHAHSQAAHLADTSVLIDDCVRKTQISIEGRIISTHIELLDCFWETGADTIITIEDCIYKTTFTKKGYTKTRSHKLDCFWEDADIINHNYLIYDQKTERCSYSFKSVWIKNDDKKTKDVSGSLSSYHIHRLGLNKIKSDTIFPDDDLREEILEAIKQQNTKANIADTSLNIQHVLNAVNTLRKSGCRCGETDMPPVAPLKWDRELEKVAFLHAKDMNQRTYFSHNTPEGISPFDRMKDHGISYSSAGENIHMGSFNGVEAIYSWKNSPVHCRNMMNSAFTNIGIARFVNMYVMLLSLSR